ncbi:MAG: tRNA pseudouridine synthase B [Candidatus Binatia bacterium]|nr:MAG: tRNA pseudouridine synthase B [Candidatus Binatia bacterium]
MDGILVVDKPEGPTSAAVVREAQKLLRTKVGHLGTLDPLATGVLPLCVGEGTKVSQFLVGAEKEYEGKIRLGKRTDTGDLAGQVVEEAPVPPIDASECRRVAAQFEGKRLQVPPMHSAIKREGVPLYKLARRGIEVRREARPVEIFELGLEPDGPDRLAFRVVCSKGTYVRVLAEEIARALGTVGVLEKLRRLRFGPFRIERALAFPFAADEARERMVGLREALEGLPEWHLAQEPARRARQGQVSVLLGLPRPPGPDSLAKLVDPEGRLVAVLRADARGNWTYARVFPSRPAGA